MISYEKKIAFSIILRIFYEQRTHKKTQFVFFLNPKKRPYEFKAKCFH